MNKEEDQEEEKKKNLGGKRYGRCPECGESYLVIYSDFSAGCKKCKFAVQDIREVQLPRLRK